MYCRTIDVNLVNGIAGDVRTYVKVSGLDDFTAVWFLKHFDTWPPTWFYSRFITPP